MSAGLIATTKYVLGDKSAFDQYVEYIDRDEATRNEYLVNVSLFADYLSRYLPDEHKGGSLFTSVKDQLKNHEKEELKNSFYLAQKNESPLWQTVISFDNDWLADNGLYDIESGVANVAKLQELTRVYMNKLLSCEKMSTTAVWSASVHYNTDHLHIHIAMVEPIPSRDKLWNKAAQKYEYKAKFKQFSLEQSKSAAINQVIGNSLECRMIHKIIRQEIIASRKSYSAESNPELAKKFTELHAVLPRNKNLWKYNNNAMKEYRPLIDELTTLYIQQHHQDSFVELRQLLKKQSDKYQEAYGQKSRAGDYAGNKLKDLYARMGNVVLKELRHYDANKKAAFLKEKKKLTLHNYKAYQNSYVLNNAIRKLCYSLKDDYEHFRNLMEYERMQQEIEHSYE